MLLGGILGDGVNVTLDVGDPFSGVVLSFSVDLGILSASLLPDLFLSGLSSLLVDTTGGLTDESGIGVDFVQGLGVVKRIVLLDVVSISVRFLLSNGTLDFVGVDDSGDIRVGHFMDGKGPSFLLLAGLSVSSKDVVKLLEGTFGPDDESSDMTSWGQLKEVKSADMSDFDSGDVSESLDEGNIGTAVDDQRSSSGSVSSVSVFSFSSSDLDGINDFLDIGPGTNVLKESNGFLGSFDLFGGVSDNQGEFGDVVNSVSSGLDQGKNN